MLICVICGQNGQGNHFGVISCRACAAFFRRAANSKWASMHCQSKLCDGKAYHCKPCRLRRCREVGMDETKFQHDRDSLMISRKRKLPPTFEILVGRPHFVIFCVPDSPSCQKTFVDLHYLVKKANDILKIGSEKPLKARNQLQKLAFGVNCLNTNIVPKKLARITREETTSFWEFYLLTVAKWLTYFDKFQDLNHDLKVKILFAVWHVWGRLDKLVATALYRTRNKDAKPTERMNSNGFVTEMVTVQGDVSWMSKHPQDRVIYFLDGIRVWDLFDLIDELQNLKISEVELTFMLAQLSFQYVKSRFGGEIGDVMDGFLETLSDDLHDYYLNEMNMPRYSARLVRLLKINNQIQENIRKHRVRGEIAKVFEIFHLDFSHPEMFQDTGLL